MSLFDELKRRNVFRVGLAYVVFSWLIIQVVETVFPAFGFGDMAVRATVILLGIGFIPALVFAWAFEKTPEGIKRERDVDRTRSITGKTGQKLDRIIIAVLLLALGYFVYDKLNQSPTGSSEGFATTNQPGGGEQTKSIAVLPFVNMSGDPANEPFTLGIHDDLLTHLSRISALKTTSRTSVMQYKGTTKTVPQIASELGVTNILEGGIQRSGNRVRINLQLINAATDEHLWAEIFDRELTAENLFAVQGEIATQVAKSMRATLLPAEQSVLMTFIYSAGITGISARPNPSNRRVIILPGPLGKTRTMSWPCPACQMLTYYWLNTATWRAKTHSPSPRMR
jgi:TolB-like protein